MTQEMMMGLIAFSMVSQRSDEKNLYNDLFGGGRGAAKKKVSNTASEPYAGQVWSEV